jgi:RNA polymerase sigma factor (TIGR02999 family)
MSDSDLDITEQLRAWRSGDAAALEQVTPFLYNELRRLARRYLRGERPDHTLTPTALINEAYLRLLGQKQPDWQNRGHFVGVVAHLMRQILVDFARHRRANKRGGGCADVPLDDALPQGVPPEADLVDLDHALLRLEQPIPARPGLSKCAISPALRWRKPPKSCRFPRPPSTGSCGWRRPGCAGNWAPTVP